MSETHMSCSCHRRPAHCLGCCGDACTSYKTPHQRWWHRLHGGKTINAAISMQCPKLAIAKMQTVRSSVQVSWLNHFSPARPGYSRPLASSILCQRIDLKAPFRTDTTGKAYYSSICSTWPQINHA